MSSGTFAKFFRPKSVLCGQVLDVAIDDVRFISFPTEVKFDSVPGQEQREIIFFNVVIAIATHRKGGSALAAQQNPLSESKECSEGAQMRARIEGVKGVASSLAAALLREEGRCGYVSSEAKAMLAVRERMDGDRDGGAKSPAPPSANRGSGGRKTASSGLSSGSSAEQSSGGGSGPTSSGSGGGGGGGSGSGNAAVVGVSSNSAISASSATGSSVNNNCSNGGSSSSSSSTSGGAGGIGNNVGGASSVVSGSAGGAASTGIWGAQAAREPDGGSAGRHEQRVIEAVMAATQFARDLTQVYDGLVSGIGTHITIHKWISLSFRLDKTPLSAADVRPYHTLLLAADEHTVIEALPQDSNPQLRRLVEASSPLKCFEELAAETDIPMPQVFRLAAHLVHWGHGRIVDTIVRSNIYQVHPDADTSVKGSATAAFAQKFPRRPLAQILSLFGPGRSLGDAMALVHANFHTPLLQMTVWLLQRGFLRQLHEYVLLLVSRPEFAAHDSPLPWGSSGSSLLAPGQAHVNLAVHAVPMLTNGGGGGTSGSGSGSGVGVQGGQHEQDVLATGDATVAGGLRPFEEAYLVNFDDGSRLFHLFRRLCPHFRGQRHVRDIIWTEGLDSWEVAQVLKTYHTVLVTYLRPEDDG